MRCRRAPPACLVVALVVAGGCRFGSEGSFTAGAEYDACDGAIPVCNTTAQCKLIEEDDYTDGEFPGFKQLIIPTGGEAIVRIKLLWRSQLSPGADTEILFYEPACIEVFRWESQGVDIFEQTGRDGIWQQEMRVYREGDHLVEVRSDATGEYVLRPEVLTVDEWELEQASLFDGAEEG